MIWSILQSRLKRYYPVLILLLILIAQSYFFRKQHIKIRDYKNFQKVQEQEIEQWKDKEGKSRARAEIAEISAKNAKRVLSNDLKELIKKEVGNIKRNLISYSSVKASTQGSIKTSSVDTIYVIDSIAALPAKHFEINNEDLQFSGKYIPQLDSLLADYKVQHNFEFFYYYRKPGKKPWNIFRRKKAYAEIKFHNHSSQADSLFTLVLERRKGFLKRLFR